VRAPDGALPAADGAVVKLLADTLCRLESIGDYLERRGWESEDGKPRPVLDLEARLRSRALDVMRERKAPVDFAEVESFILEAHRRFHFTLRLDPWQGLDLAQRLRAAHVRAEEFNFSSGSKQRLAATLLSALNAGHMRLYEAEGLRMSCWAWGWCSRRRGCGRLITVQVVTTIALRL
jgi:hypothetical protein